MKKLIIILMMVLLSSVVSATPSDVFSGLSHYYNFSQTSGQLLDSYGSLDSSTIEISGSQTATGKSGNGWLFDGSGAPDCIEIPNTIIAGKSAITINLWANWTNVFSESKLFSTYNSGTRMNRYSYLAPTTARWGFATTTTQTDLDTTDLRPLNEWRMYTYTYDDATDNGSVYINGTFIGSITHTGVVGEGGEDFTIGNLDAGAHQGGCANANRGFGGVMDEFAVWDRALTESEVLKLYNSGDGLFYPLAVTTPLISIPICTSCNDGTNETTDSTPTINVTVTDNMGVQMVRISNNSAYNFSNATSSRNCTQGVGNDWVCTLPTSDQLVTFNKNQTLFFWANDTAGNYHTIYNLTINVSLIDLTPPSFSGLQNNATSVGTGYSVQFNISITDNYLLDYYIFSWNDSGSWVNSSVFLGVQTVKVIENKTITAGALANIAYTWYMNDSFGNLNQTGIFNFNLLGVSPTNLFLNGLEQNRTYEYETTANITTDGSFIDILDNTFRYRDLTSPFNYTINLLRINKINKTNISVTISSGSSNNISIDNRTDLYNATVNITGFTQPMNASLSYGKILLFPGTLIGNTLYQHLFMALVEINGLYEAYNLSFSTAGRRTVFLNFSSQGDLNRTGYLNFTINAYDLDKGNDLDFTENFSNSENINLSTLYNTSAHMSVFDNFEDNVTSEGRWSVDNDCSGNNRVTYENSDNYYNFQNSHTGSSASGTSCTNKLDYNSVDIGLNNISAFNISAYAYCGWSRGNGHSTTLNIKLKAKDSENDLDIYTIFGCSGSGSGIGSSFKTVLIHGSKNADGTWDIYENDTIKKNDLSLVSLNSPVKLRFQIDAGGNTGGEGYSYSTSGLMNIFNINTSGLRIRVTNGTYDNADNASFESSTLSNTSNNIARVFLTADTTVPEGTSLVSQASNDNGTTYENVTLNNFHTFISTGSALRIKFILNTTNTSITPIVRSYRAQIVPAAVSGLDIDVGLDGISDMSINYELNASTTPVRYNGTDIGINKYINRSCKHESYCVIPLSVSVTSGGIIEISDLNLTEVINPVRFNVSVIQDLNFIPLNLSYTGGTIQVDDVKFDFRGSKNITVVAHSGDYSTSLNRTILVKDSNFNLFFPSGQEYIQNFYKKRNESNVEPYGQNSTAGILRATSLAYDGNINIYIKYNESVNTCITKREFKGENYSFGVEDGLVAYYKFNENSSRDYSRENNDGTVSGAIWNSTGGVSGDGAFEFNGSGDYIEIKSDSSLDFQNFTFTIWFKSTPDNSWIAHPALFMRGNNVGANELFIGLSDETQDVVQLILNNTAQLTDTNIDLLDQTWHFMAVTYNSTNLTLYIDYDSFINVFSNNNTLDFGISNAWIGADSDSFQGSLGNYWNGTIDEVSIFNRSLSASEISTIYNDQKTKYFSNTTILLNTYNVSGTQTGLVSWYPFYEEGALDHAGTNNGVVTGAVYTSGSGVNGTGAYEFDGTENKLISISNSDDFKFNGSDEFTLSLWVYVATLHQSNSYPMPISFQSSTGGRKGYDITYINSSNGFKFEMFNGTTNSVNFAVTSSTGWYHLVAIVNSTDISAYTNGVLDNKANRLSEHPAIAIDGEVLIIGARSTTAYMWNGSIDEVSIFNVSLSASEVLTLYQNTQPRHSSPITGIADGQKVIENLDIEDTNGDLWVSTNINCSGSNYPLVESWICLFSHCNECVKTQDFQSNCEWMI